MVNSFVMDTIETAAIQRRVLAWYKKHKRTLPWRETYDPYHILVSEVMLQQTQVSRVIEKYHEFLRIFKTIYELASATPAQVITVWKGLGYNRRALFLQKTAQAVVGTHNGVFPSTVEALMALPGVGAYTARAILSFAFRQPTPMMDTNHRRFYQRVLFGKQWQSDQQLFDAACVLLPPKKSYEFNQALMDFGSLVCTTNNPACHTCPLSLYCLAYKEGNGVIAQKPKKKKQSIPFRDTDRYVRGRIIDYLREHVSVPVATLRIHCVGIDDERFDRILKRLVLDGLIVIEKNRVKLP